MDYRERLFEVARSVSVIDTHEHLPTREGRRERGTDVLREYLRHYISSDVVSAGLSAQDLEFARDASLPIMDRWAVVEPYWEASRLTGYGRAIDLSVRALYGVDGMNRDSLEELNGKFLATLEGGQYKKVLKDQCNIHTCILDNLEDNLDCDREFFTPVFRIDELIQPDTVERVRLYEARSGISANSVQAYAQMCIKLIEDAMKQGAIGLKCALAYRRTLDFCFVSTAEAERDFCRLMQGKHDAMRPGAVAFSKRVEDYLMHRILSYVNENGMLMQIHTGLLEGNGNQLNHSDPALLAPLLLAYPNARFDLFHIGYPYQEALCALVKMFPNATADFAWAHIISPIAARNALSTMLETVPVNKISAFGGDYVPIDCVVGHLQIARQNVCVVLDEKIRQGLIDLTRAEELLKMLFFENPKRIFKI